MMSQPIYLPSAPGFQPGLYPVAPVTVSPGAWPAAFAVPAPARGQAPVAPRPIIRAKGPDDPAPAPGYFATAATVSLSIPTPEQLGVPLAPVQDGAGLDWTAAHRRLERLGAVCLHMDKLETGASRFTCILPTRQPGITHRVEAVAATSGEAVGLVLSQAEQWASAGNNPSN